MKAFLRHCSKRWGYDGWAAKIKGADSPIWWTVSTTREEVRQLLKEAPLNEPDFFQRLEIVKVKIIVEVA